MLAVRSSQVTPAALFLFWVPEQSSVWGAVTHIHEYLRRQLGTEQTMLKDLLNKYTKHLSTSCMGNIRPEKYKVKMIL